MQPAENLQDAIFSASAPVLIGLMFRLAIFHPRKAFHETGNWPAHLQTHYLKINRPKVRAIVAEKRDHCRLLNTKIDQPKPSR